jgi:hypothetical protein
MTFNLRNRRTALAVEIIGTVPPERLIGAIGSILEHRRQRARGFLPEGPHDLEVDVGRFIQTCSMRQLKLLREIALDLEIACEGAIQ